VAAPEVVAAAEDAPPEEAPAAETLAETPADDTEPEHHADV
jgi:hypothetical protein